MERKEEVATAERIRVMESAYSHYAWPTALPGRVGTDNTTCSLV
jgi:hypothetical protein